MPSLLATLTTQLHQGLQRKSSTSASRWATNYIVLGKPIPGPMTFDFFPWSKVWCDNSKSWVGAKSSQMSMTHSALTRALYTIDILRNDVLYVLPKKNPDAADFSKSKFDTLLELSLHLRDMFSNVRNVGHKQAGSVNFFLRGSRSRSGLKSISVGLKIFDEFDEMNQKNVPLAEERSAGYQQEDIQTIKISTPTFPDFGISKEYDVTNQQHYMFRCPSCSRQTELIYPECLVIPTDDPNDIAALKRSYIRCTVCKNQLPGTSEQNPKSNYRAKQSWLNLSNAYWQPTKPQNQLDGYHIHGFYSITRPIEEMSKKVLLSQTDQVVKEELYNSILAKPFVADGARVSIQQVEACKSNHKNLAPPQSKLVTMGVDVGHKVLYFTIDEWLLPLALSDNINNQAIPRTIAIGVVPNFIELNQLLYTYQVIHTVVDVDPESREAFDFANANPGRVNLCRFVSAIKKRSVAREASDNVVVQVNRTIWLDISQGRFMNRKILLPHNLPNDYPKHISALIKKQTYDDEGNLKAKYINVSADHWAFSRVYSEVALPLALSVAENRDIASFL